MPCTFPSATRAEAPAPARRTATGPARSITSYPPSFDWSTLQAAPPEGQTGHLHGDEWIAFGGPGSDENPAGVGLMPRGRRPRGPLPLPNLEDPSDRLRIPGRRPAPACFAPIPLAWRERSARPDRRKAPWPFFPEDLDWARFQAAPPSQRLPFLSGDEPFALTGMHAGRSAPRGSLPGLQLRCTALREGRREPEEVELRLDTVVIDVTQMTVHLVWRGALPVPDERQPDIRKVTLRARHARG